MAQQISEDILIIGGGPAGGMLANIFGNIHDYSVRVIERYPDLNDPSVDFNDRSGNFTVSYKTQDTFYKYGLKQEFNSISNPTDKFGIVIQDIQLKLDFMPHTKCNNFTVARRDVSSLLNKKNAQNPNIVYEYETKVLKVDMENKIIETENRKDNTKQQRKFKFIIGADGYNSEVRQGIDSKLGTKTRLEEFPNSVKNLFVPNYQNFLRMQDEVKQGKYPLYQKLDDKYRKMRKLAGKYIMDPNMMTGYGSQNLWILGVPISEGQINVVIGMSADPDTIQNFVKIHPEYKDRVDLSEEFNFHFGKYQTDEEIHEFLVTHVPQFYGLCPDLVEQWKNSPVFKTHTVFCDNWYLNGDACLFGDACNGMSYQTANGHNVTMENIDVFFQIFSRRVGENKQQFLEDENLRKEIFTEYQNTQFKNARACQDGDIRDSIFPGLTYMQHPKSQLFNAVDAKLHEIMPTIYNSKLNLCHFSTGSFYESQTKGNIFVNYILEKIKNADKIEDVDLSNAKQEITELLEKEKLPIEYSINPSCITV